MSTAVEELENLVEQLAEAESRATVNQDEVLRTLMSISRAAHDGIAELVTRAEA